MRLCHMRTRTGHMHHLPGLVEPEVVAGEHCHLRLVVHVQDHVRLSQVGEIVDCKVEIVVPRRFATPLCCAIFEQRASISVDSVESDVREKAMQLKEKPKLLYYNKGL